jgi:hypothetical protein
MKMLEIHTTQHWGIRGGEIRKSLSKLFLPLENFVFGDSKKN